MALTRLNNNSLLQTTAGDNFRNIIINGDMSIAQRGTSATGLGEGDNGYHTCDRWQFLESGTSTYEFTQTQDNDVPTGQGFAYSLKMTCTTAVASVPADNLQRISQFIEGQNLQYLKYGTANAQSLTASFWVKSNVTGDYNTHLYAPNATNRIITSTFTINSADTWEKKTITFAGDTAQTIINDNAARIHFTITLLAGTNFNSTDGTSWGAYSSSKIAYGQTANVASSTSNYFNYTGVQLEAGTTASDFEFLPIDIKQTRCERYYQKAFNQNQSDNTNATSHVGNGVTFKTEMRATPSASTGTVHFSGGGAPSSFTHYFSTTYGSAMWGASTALGNYYWYQTNLYDAEL